MPKVRKRAVVGGPKPRAYTAINLQTGHYVPHTVWDDADRARVRQFCKPDPAGETGPCVQPIAGQEARVAAHAARAQRTERLIRARHPRPKPRCLACGKVAPLSSHNARVGVEERRGREGPGWAVRRVKSPRGGCEYTESICPKCFAAHGWGDELGPVRVVG